MRFHHATVPRAGLAPDSVAAMLYARYFSDGEAVPSGASSHWQAFSRRFRVKLGNDGLIQELVGHGFGVSDHWSPIWRAFAWVGNGLHLAWLDAPGLESDVRGAKQLVRRMGLSFSQDAFRQAATDWFLERSLRAAGKIAPRTILLIGDGHGILAALLHERYRSARILLVDLGPTLLFQAVHLSKAFPSAPHVLAGDAQRSVDSGFVYCPADKIDDLPADDIDLAVNVASMQEMTPAVITSYFKLLRARRTGLFYCCNRLEKRLPGGELLRFYDYPWAESDVHLVDEACPWHQWFFAWSRSPHVKLGYVPLPLLHRYEGVPWHRLSQLTAFSE